MLSFSTRHLFIFAVVLLILSHVCVTFLFSTGNFKLYGTDDCTSALFRCNQSLISQWPAGAAALEAKVIRNFIQRTVFQLEWTAYVENLRCFQILIRSDGIPDICQIMDYTEQSNTTVTYSLHFSTQIPLTRYNRNYVIELYTLPQWNAKPMVLSKNLSVYECTSWQATFQHGYDGEQIEVTFDKGPQRCNFKNYSVTLFDANSKSVFRKIVEEKENSSKLTAIFSDPLCKGKYYIVIRKAWDKHQGCLAVDGTYRYCTGSKSALETYIPRIPCYRDRIPTNETASIPEKEGDAAIWIICVLVVVFVIVYIAYILKKLQMKPKNRGIVLFVDDYPAHTKAVMVLVDYLRKCHLDISLASHFLKHHEDNNQLNVLAEALKSDFVLLVISSAFQKRMEAWDKQQDYIEFFKEKNSNILTEKLLEKITLWNKIYVCKFDHVTEYGSWSHPCYSLPSHLSEMVKELASVGFNFSTFKYFKKKILLDKLTVAVKDAADFEHSNSEWFHKKYFCPRTIVTEENSYTEHM